MIELHYSTVETNWGNFLIASTKSGVCQLHYLQNNNENFFNWLEKKFGHRGTLNHEKNRLAAIELIEYLEGKRKIFESPLDLIGTTFQKRVWEQLRKIPYGETVCYSEIAQSIQVPKGARAVGMANNANPVLLMVPCHRVIGKNGSLVGYESGIELKEKFLKLEKENK